MVRICLIACVSLLAAATPAAAQLPRQYYTKFWEKQGNYFFRYFYYKTVETAPSYRYHLVINYPSDPQYYYYYNPYIEKYWGRYDRKAGGFSPLPEQVQQKLLNHINDKSFPEAAGMPILSDTKDELRMARPPEEEALVERPRNLEFPKSEKLAAKFQSLPANEAATISAREFAALAGVADTKELPQQAFSGWVKTGGYYFCCHYYQPVPGGPYKSHRCIYYPSQPQYIYYYNPYKCIYWGRYDLKNNGYSLLQDKDKAGRISEIAEGAFPQPGAMPPVPEAGDRQFLMLRPPTGLPE